MKYKTFSVFTLTATSRIAVLTLLAIGSSYSFGACIPTKTFDGKIVNSCPGTSSSSSSGSQHTGVDFASLPPVRPDPGPGSTSNTNTSTTGVSYQTADDCSADEFLTEGDVCTNIKASGCATVGAGLEIHFSCMEIDSEYYWVDLGATPTPPGKAQTWHLIDYGKTGSRDYCAIRDDYFTVSLPCVIGENKISAKLVLDPSAKARKQWLVKGAPLYLFLNSHPRSEVFAAMFRGESGVVVFQHDRYGEKKISRLIVLDGYKAVGEIILDNNGGVSSVKSLASSFDFSRSGLLGDGAIDDFVNTANDDVNNILIMIHRALDYVHEGAKHIAKELQDGIEEHIAGPLPDQKALTWGFWEIMACANDLVTCAERLLADLRSAVHAGIPNIEPYTRTIEKEDLKSISASAHPIAIGEFVSQAGMDSRIYCEPGYIMQTSNGKCVEECRSYGSTRKESCTVENGTGWRVSSCNGEVWSNPSGCSRVTCDAGYKLLGSQCIEDSKYIAQFCSNGNSAPGCPNNSSSSSRPPPSNGSPCNNGGTYINGVCLAPAQVAQLKQICAIDSTYPQCQGLPSNPSRPTAPNGGTTGSGGSGASQDCDEPDEARCLTITVEDYIAANNQAADSLVGTWLSLDGAGKYIFSGNGTGRLVAQSINGNPGVSTTYFNWSATTSRIDLKITKLTLTQSCCDYVDNTSSSHSMKYSLRGNMLSIEGGGSFFRQ